MTLSFNEKKECVAEEVFIDVSSKRYTGDIFNKWAYPVFWGNELYCDVYGNNKEEAIDMAINVVAEDWEIEEARK